MQMHELYSFGLVATIAEKYLMILVCNSLLYKRTSFPALVTICSNGMKQSFSGITKEYVFVNVPQFVFSKIFLENHSSISYQMMVTVTGDICIR